MEEIGKNKEQKPVIQFKESERGMVCNKTNWNTIVKVTGSEESDNWTGKQIGLYRTEVQYGDEMVESIRIKLQTKGAKAPPTKSVTVDKDEGDIPF